jgi:hypothetical protein
MVGKLASTNLLLLDNSLSADSCSLFHSVMFIAFMHYGVRLLQLFNVIYTSRFCLDFIKNELIFLCFLTFHTFTAGVY